MPRFRWYFQIASFAATALFVLAGPVDVSSSRSTLRVATAAGEAVAVSAELEEAKRLQRLGDLLVDRGRLSEAVARFEKALAIRRRLLGSDHPGVGEVARKLGNLYRRLGRYPEAEDAYRTALQVSEKTFGIEHAQTAGVLVDLGILHRFQDRLAEAENLLQRAVKILEREAGPDSLDVASPLAALGVVYTRRNRFEQAEAAFRRAIEIYRTANGDGEGHFAQTYVNYGRLLQLEGRLTEAEQVLRDSLEFYDKQNIETAELAVNLNNLAIVLRRFERFDEAERLYRRAIRIYEHVLGHGHPDVGVTVNNLAKLFVKRGLYEKAEPLYRRALAIFEERYGPDHSRVSHALTNLAELYYETGKLSDANQLAERALKIRTKAFDAEHYRVGESLELLAGIRRGLGEPDQARKLYRRALAVQEKAVGKDHPLVARILTELAADRVAEGRLDEAERFYRRALDIRSAAYGERHSTVIDALDGLATVYQRLGRLDEALESVRRATSIARTLVARLDNKRAKAALNLRSRLRGTLVNHVSITTARGPVVSDPELVSETFEAAQLGLITTTATAVADMASRFSTGETRLAQAVRVWQDTMAAWRRLNDLLVEAVGRPPETRNARAESRMRQRLALLDRRLSETEESLTRDFPEFVELTSPQPVALAEVQELLGDDEALLVYLVATERSYVWVLRRDKAALVRLEIGHEDLESAVIELRDRVDPFQIRRVSDLKKFDVELAHRLYKTIFQPAEALLEGVDLVNVVLDGPLQSIPLDMLIAEAPEPILEVEDFRDVAWLGSKYALTVLPSVSSLRGLRLFAPKLRAKKRFVGFGDPALEGEAAATKGIPFFGGFRAAPSVIDAQNLRALPRLPETAEELYAIARALRGEARYVFLADEATERRVRSFDLSAFQVVAFSTHGLIAGDFRHLYEPALVLTPPPTGSESDDGVLTASEVATLRLNADWTILSACNTAAPDGTPGAEGLSGLAKAFLYAGSRALLVSHWSVNSEATVHLITRIFAEIAKHPRLPRAEAVRRARLDLIHNGKRVYFAHPMFWAPFVLVGDGGPLIR